MKVMFIEYGMGIDLHGQDVTKAAVRAVRHAIGHNSLPGMRSLLENGDLTHMKVRVTLAVPSNTGQVDVNAVAAMIPYRTVEVRLVDGGMVANSGVVLKEKGDDNDHVYIVNAQVEVGL